MRQTWSETSSFGSPPTPCSVGRVEAAKQRFNQTCVRAHQYLRRKGVLGSTAVQLISSQLVPVTSASSPDETDVDEGVLLYLMRELGCSRSAARDVLSIKRQFLLDASLLHFFWYLLDFFFVCFTSLPKGNLSVAPRYGCGCSGRLPYRAHSQLNSNPDSIDLSEEEVDINSVRGRKRPKALSHQVRFEATRVRGMENVFIFGVCVCVCVCSLICIIFTYLHKLPCWDSVFGCFFFSFLLQPALL